MNERGGNRPAQAINLVRRNAKCLDGNAPETTYTLPDHHTRFFHQQDSIVCTAKAHFFWRFQQLGKTTLQIPAQSETSHNFHHLNHHIDTSFLRLLLDAFLRTISSIRNLTLSFHIFLHLSDHRSKHLRNLPYKIRKLNFKQNRNSLFIFMVLE